MSEDEMSGFENYEMQNDTDWPRCRNSSHFPPSMMVVPHGKRYRHICPGCGFIMYLYPSIHSYFASPASKDT